MSPSVSGTSCVVLWWLFDKGYHIWKTGHACRWVMCSSNRLHFTSNSRHGDFPRICNRHHYETIRTLTYYPFAIFFRLFVKDLSHVTRRTMSHFLSKKYLSQISVGFNKVSYTASRPITLLITDLKDASFLLQKLLRWSKQTRALENIY